MQIASEIERILADDGRTGTRRLVAQLVELFESYGAKAEGLKLGSRLTVEGVDAVVVPVEPSREMRVSGRDKLRSLFVEMACEADAEDAYRAMLSAAGDER